MNWRRLARNLAFQSLFELEARPDTEVERVVESRSETHAEETGESAGPEARDFAGALVRGALEHREQIDERIQRAAPAFPVDQLPTTDRVALELAMYEMLIAHDAPVRVVINEAVELAKTYGGENSGRFVNGVLGTIAGEQGDGNPSRAATQKTVRETRPRSRQEEERDGDRSGLN